MKFIISEAEARNVIASRYSLPQGTKVVISRSRVRLKGLASSTVDAIARIEQNLPANLIGAIKELRAACGYSLFDAKTAVENWTSYKQTLVETRTWPALKVSSDRTRISWEASNLPA